MKFPKLILFDYGNTIGAEGFDGEAGTRALMAYMTENPNNLTAEQIQDAAQKINQKLGRFGSTLPLAEVHQYAFQHFLYEYLGIRFSIGDAEIERIFWDHASPASLTPHMDTLLAALQEMGIQAGVISNISYSGKALERRIRELCGDYPFLFVMASSEYVFRKPEPLLFELALRKAGVQAGEDVWYCGDNYSCDVEGARKAGIFPVWYRPGQGKDPRDNCLQVHDWMEVAALLEELKKR